MKPRGQCLIISNEHFYDSDNREIADMRRVGTSMDASRLKRLFEMFHFETDLKVDLSESEMRREIAQFAKENERYSQMYDACVLIILSHGTDGYIYGCDLNNRLKVKKN